MTLVDTLVSEKIAQNPFHAANMLNVLKCAELKTDEERIARCRLYKEWKLAGENKVVAREKAILGKPAPERLLKTEAQLLHELGFE